MPGNTGNGISALKRSGERCQSLVLEIGKRRRIAALKLYTDGKIVTATLALPTGFARVPGTFFAGNKLDSLTVSPDEKMRRNFKAAKGLVIRMSSGIDSVGE